jgi:membrane peptidoglycan carboxypeptidase
VSFPLTRRLLAQVESDLKRILTTTTWSCDELSDLEILILLLEDRRFFQHQGVDILSVLRELFRMFTFQRFGGASTIDMQFVRTRTGYRRRRVGRKLYEMILAHALQSRMSKLAILRAYLREVYLGWDLHGVESATRSLFGKSADELDRDEAATIAAMMVYPQPLNPSPTWRAKVQRRAAYGLRLFAKYGQRYRAVSR